MTIRVRRSALSASSALSAVSALSVACATLLVAGCISVGVGNSDGGVQAQYRLSDLAAAPVRAEATVPRTVVVAAMPSLGIGDTFSMAYSRAPQERSLYQFASWAERPSNRVVQLIVRRLEARGSFATVVELGSGVSGTLLLNVTVDELVHDTAAQRGRIQLTAELVDRTTRSLAARRRFEAAAPVPTENARGAVAALSRALTDALDQLVPWVESAARGLPATAAR